MIDATIDGSAYENGTQYYDLSSDSLVGTYSNNSNSFLPGQVRSFVSDDNNNNNVDDIHEWLLNFLRHIPFFHTNKTCTAFIKTKLSLFFMQAELVSPPLMTQTKNKTQAS